MKLTLKKTPKAKPIKPIKPKHVFNLANYNKKPTNYPALIIGLVIVLAAAFAIGKFAVVDRFAALDKANAEAAALQAQIDSNYAQIESMDGVTEVYAHYTYSGMTADELALVSRSDVMNMISSVVLPNADVTSWTLQGNTLTMRIDNTTLANVNQIVALMETQDIVNYSFVQTAASTTNKDTSEYVSAQITVYLQMPVTEEQTSAEEETTAAAEEVAG